jgi:hypothetical protein
MSWLKYRHKFASHAGGWEYRELPEGEDLATVEEVLSALAEQYDWSDKYRGLDWWVVDRPPRRVLMEKLDRAERDRKEAEQRYRRVFAQYEASEPCPTCDDRDPPPEYEHSTYGRCDDCGNETRNPQVVGVRGGG